MRFTGLTHFTQFTALNANHSHLLSATGTRMQMRMIPVSAQNPYSQQGFSESA
jgi:hypothetical protein